MNEYANDRRTVFSRQTAKLSLVFMGLLLAGAAVWMFFPVESWLSRAHGWFATKGSDGAAVFLVVYIVAVILLVPGTLLALSAALVYGFWALPLVLTGATIGASFAFLITRYLAHERVTSFVQRRRRLRAVMGAVKEGGWQIVGLARLSPLVPFNLQNYFFGLTGIPFWHYAAATLVGIIPSSAVKVYLGTLGGIALSDSEKYTMRGSMFVLGLIATIVVTWLITRKAKEKLAKAGITASQGRTSCDASKKKNC